MERRSLSYSDGPITVDRKQLVEDLNFIKKSLPAKGSKPMEPEMKNIFFDTEKMFSCNGTTLSVICGEYDFGIYGCFEGFSFINLISMLGGKKVKLEFDNIKEGVGQLVAKSGTASFGVRYYGKTKLHSIVKQIDVDSVTKWHRLTSDIKEALLMCAMYTSKDNMRPAITGVLANKEEVIATDRYRINWIKFKKPTHFKGVVIPGTALAYINEFTHYAVFDKRVFFKNGNRYFVSVLITNEFPLDSSKKLFPKISKKTFSLPTEINKAIDGVLALVEEDFILDKTINVTVKSGTVVCKAEKKELGEGEVYEIRKIIDYEKNQEFVRSFLERQKKEGPNEKTSNSF